jgi:small subunit ribosomal protein S9
MKAKASSTIEVFKATGRRKTSNARIMLKAGKGNIQINGMPSAEYLHRATLQMLIEEPLAVTRSLGKVDISANVRGGGKSGQAGAVRHGISRALLLLDSQHRPLLRKGGFLTRDPRAKERKKYGQKGARKRFQFSKR